MNGYWFLSGLGGVLITFPLFNFFKKKYISYNEAMILAVLFLCGPAGFVIAVIALVGRVVIEVNSQPNTPLFDWRKQPDVRAIECPMCDWWFDVLPGEITTCPNCKTKTKI